MDVGLLTNFWLQKNPREKSPMSTNLKKMGYHVWLSNHNRKNYKFEFSALTCLLQLCKSTCSSTYCVSSNTSASVSQNWFTKDYANKPMTIQALKGMNDTLYHWCPPTVMPSRDWKFRRKNVSDPAKPRRTFTGCVVPYIIPTCLLYD